IAGRGSSWSTWCGEACAGTPASPISGSRSRERPKPDEAPSPRRPRSRRHRPRAGGVRQQRQRRRHRQSDRHHDARGHDHDRRQRHPRLLSETPPALAGFERSTFTHDGKTRDVYRIGSGPAVVVIAEVPGITPKVAEFGRRVADIGCTAVLPRLFGEPGRPASGGYVMQSLAPACISGEFSCFATRKTSPVTVWLRALARQMHTECGGPGVGAVGMCFTGGFALAMMVDEVVLAPVLSQPSSPFPITKAHRRDLGISDDDLARVKERCANEEDLCVL